MVGADRVRRDVCGAEDPGGTGLMFMSVQLGARPLGSVLPSIPEFIISKLQWSANFGSSLVRLRGNENESLALQIKQRQQILFLLMRIYNSCTSQHYTIPLCPAF